MSFIPVNDAVPKSTNEFLASFYAVSDKSGPAAHAEYTSHFLPSATLIMGPKIFPGHGGVHTFREGAWEHVERRRHVIQGVFAGSEGEVMLYGTVDYGMKDGTQVEGVQWAGRMVLSPTDRGPKISFYQVYITAK
ncbi:hypothetical protein PLICRDRAFT_694220 [Plicaturopsis crispa FD-325 SS-3]|nr:hypothetical protein PLICRDRAFT_694220 [Plicaturopsis crispa FD-325 SS-3]